MEHIHLEFLGDQKLNYSQETLTNLTSKLYHLHHSNLQEAARLFQQTLYPHEKYFAEHIEKTI